MSELQLVSRILAIRLARLGDITLLLPSLGLLKSAFPGASLAMLTDLPYAPLANLCPSVDDVISIDRIRMRDGPRLQAVRDGLGLVKRLRAQNFDLVVDFQGFRETNLMAWASGARYRLGLKPTSGSYLGFCFNLPPSVRDESLHVAEVFPGIVRSLPGLGKLDRESGPSLRIPPAPIPVSGLTVVMSVGASVAARRWPVDRFAALAAHVVDAWGASVLVLSGVTPEERPLAERVAARAGRGRKVRLLPELTIPEMVATIAGADVLVSNDSGPMHVGSAVGVPTLGIFSEGPPHHYGPIGPMDRFIHRSRVEDVEIEDVVAILEEMRVAGFQ